MSDLPSAGQRFVPHNICPGGNTPKARTVVAVRQGPRSATIASLRDGGWTTAVWGLAHWNAWVEQHDARVEGAP